VRFPMDDVLACILERVAEPLRGLTLPPMDAEQAWVLTEFLDEVQEAIWMDHGIEIAEYLDNRDRLDCYHSTEDADARTLTISATEDLDF